MSTLPTYVVLRTIAHDGTPVTHLPTAQRIEARFEPYPSGARYGEALALAVRIRRNERAGWAIPLDESDLPMYEPKETHTAMPTATVIARHAIQAYAGGRDGRTIPLDHGQTVEVVRGHSDGVVTVLVDGVEALVAGTAIRVDSDEPTIEVALAGSVHRLLATESNWPTDCPRGWASIATGKRAKRGRGYRIEAELVLADAADLADYLESVADICTGAGVDSRDGKGPMLTTVTRIREALALREACKAEHLYAATTRLTGIFHFTSAAERAEWIAEHAGFEIEASQVDPEIRAQFEAVTA